MAEERSKCKRDHTGKTGSIQMKRKQGKAAHTEDRKRKPRRVPTGILLLMDLLLAAAILVCVLLLMVRQQQRQRPVLSQLVAPDWHVQEFLRVNPYSRPGTKRENINSIVVHYVANPGTTARQNRNYFDSLADQETEDPISASSHYIIGIDGQILQCIPLDEVAYANYPRNEDTVSIECCHPDGSGEFTEATRESLVKLTAWLCQELKLNQDDVLRHYDVIGKNCPLYYVQHEDAWLELKAEVKAALKALK